jgi:hypothetical protein
LRLLAKVFSLTKYYLHSIIYVLLFYRRNIMAITKSQVVDGQGNAPVNQSPAQGHFDDLRAQGACVTAWNGNGTPAACQTQQIASPLPASTDCGWQPNPGELVLDA